MHFRWFQTRPQLQQHLDMQITHSVWMSLNLVFLIRCLSTRLSGWHWSPAEVSQHAWSCVIRYQAAFSHLSRAVKAVLCDSPVLRLCCGPAGPRHRVAPAHTRVLMDGPVLMSSEGNHMEPSLLEAQASEGGS